MRCANEGHTLLELVIAFGLGLALTGAGLSLYRGQHAAFSRIAERAQMVDAGFSALHFISIHLRLAGFSLSPRPPSSAALLGCRLGRPVSVGNPSGHSVCQSDQRIRSDSLEVRYAVDSVSTWPAANGRPTDCLGQAIVDTRPSASFHTFSINRFFVRKSPSTGKTELYCEGSGRPGLAQPLVENVEHLRVLYKLAHTTEWIDATAVQPGQWSAIAAVDLCVEVSGARTSKPVPYLDCSGMSVIASDARLRQAFTKQVAIRNR